MKKKPMKVITIVLGFIVGIVIYVGINAIIRNLF